MNLGLFLELGVQRQGACWRGSMLRLLSALVIGSRIGDLPDWERSASETVETRESKLAVF